MGKYTTIMAVEDWPSIPGHPDKIITWGGKRKAVSADGRHWLVRKDGLFKRWSWRPVDGMFVKLKEVK